MFENDERTDGWEHNIENHTELRGDSRTDDTARQNSYDTYRAANGEPSGDPQGAPRQNTYETYGGGGSQQTTYETYGGGGSQQNANHSCNYTYGGNESQQSTYETSGAGGFSNGEPTGGPQNGPGRRQRRPRRKMHAFVKALCCGIIFGLAAGALIIGSTIIGRRAAARQVPIETTTAKLSTAEEASAGGQESGGQSSGTYTVSQITKQCKSSVVAITNKSISEIQTMFGVLQQENEGSGSGVIIGKNDTELLIVTNNHVVENSETLTVCFNDSEDAVFNAQIKGKDENNDLAVIAIKLSDISDEVLNSISIATVGDSSKLQVGDEVVAIGNALGFGQSVTSGIVSALDREVTIDDTKATLLQTDAAINPGNSGGALFNMKGELIGINSAKYASEQIEGMGFAIPMATAQPIVENLMTQETREKLDKNYGYLNISGNDVTADENERYGIPKGVYVDEVTSGGAADKAGVQAGDIITGIGGKSITGMDQLREELTYYKAGEKVELTVQRSSGGKYTEQKLTVTLDNASDYQNSGQGQGNTGGQGNQDDGSQTDPYFGNGWEDFFGFR